MLLLLLYSLRIPSICICLSTVTLSVGGHIAITEQAEEITEETQVFSLSCPEDLIAALSSPITSFCKSFIR